jgi:hypothetical protein
LPCKIDEPDRIDELQQEIEKANGRTTGEVEDLTRHLQSDNPKVVRYAKTGDYEIFTLDLTTSQPTAYSEYGYEQASCDDYGGSACINIITKNGAIIFQNTPHLVPVAE